jgi:hypothetical protein
LRTHLLFFPLWLGYILCTDRLVLSRTQTSLLRRSPGGFWTLFLVSIPLWWIFELLNLRLRNWEYLGRENFTDIEYFLLASLSFSTVVPAVFETAELLGTWFPASQPQTRKRTLVALRGLLALALSGCLMIMLLLVWPRFFYPMAWISLIFIVEPTSKLLHRNCLLDYFEMGDWRPFAQLALGALVCGFFWEMWNAYSYPKWIYHTPGTEFAHIFEMPALGYIGYLAFGLELYSLTHLILGSSHIKLLSHRTVADEEERLSVSPQEILR